MKRILFYTNIPSPYRIAFFNELGKYCELTVLFEASFSTERDESWSTFEFKNFNGIIMRGKRTHIDRAWCPEVTRYLAAENYDEIIIAVISSLTAIRAVKFLKKHHISYCFEGDGGFAGNEGWLSIKRIIKTCIISGAKKCFSTSEAFDNYLKYYRAKRENIVRYPFSSVKDSDVLTDLELADLLNGDAKARLKDELGIKEAHIIVSIGRIDPIKGFDTLIKAFASIPDTNRDDFKIIIIGGEPYKELKAILSSFSENARNQIEFIGFQKKEDIYKYLKMADFFVLPTNYDPWGLVINEAMACGNPIITTYQCIAGLELVDYDNGALYDCKDEGLLKEYLIWLMKLSKENDEAYKSMCRRSVKKVRGYTIETMVSAHVKEMICMQAD